MTHECKVERGGEFRFWTWLIAKLTKLSPPIRLASNNITAKQLWLGVA
jgi:hypothetical protein